MSLLKLLCPCSYSNEFVFSLHMNIIPRMCQVPVLLAYLSAPRERVIQMPFLFSMVFDHTRKEYCSLQGHSKLSSVKSYKVSVYASTCMYTHKYTLYTKWVYSVGTLTRFSIPLTVPSLEFPESMKQATVSGCIFNSTQVRLDFFVLKIRGAFSELECQGRCEAL